MAKNQNLIMGLVLGGCIAAVACGSSSDDTSNSGGGTGGHSGRGGSASSNAGAHSGGSGGGSASGGTSSGGTSSGGKSAGGSGGGTSPGGKAGSTAGGGANAGGEGGATVNGEAGAGGEAAGGAAVLPHAFNPHFVLVPGVTPVTQNHLLVAGTDYVKTEVVSITLQPAGVGDTTTYADGDAIPVSSAGVGFVLERSNDKVHLLDGGKIKTTFDLTDPGTATTALTDNKAYVGLYNKSLISILDLAAGKVSRRIDLSQFNDPNDTDGSADITAAAYDSTKKIAYFLLARIDLNTIAPPDFHQACPTSNALVVGIDATTDAVVDLNGAAAGKAFELSLVAPESVALAADGKTLTVLSSGCYNGATLRNDGVEILDLDQGTSKIAYAPKGTDFLSALILVGQGDALLHSADANFSESWHRLNLGSGSLGAALSGVPSAPAYDGTDLLGISVATTVGSVVRYAIGSGTSAQVTATSWSGQYSSAAGTALVQ